MPQRPGTRPTSLRFLTFVGICLGVTLSAVPVQAVSFLRPQELPELVRESTRAVLARVVDVRYGFDDRRLHSTWVTLQVEDALYGRDVPEPGGLFTIKVYGAPEPLSDGSRVFLDGTPRYAAGQRYLLLLIEESRWGFTNTAGLFQGAFAIDAAGRVAGLTAADRVFGEGGLTGLPADGPESTRGAEAAAPAPPAQLTYPMLRQAVTAAWTDIGRALRDPDAGRDGRPAAAAESDQGADPAPPGEAADPPRGLAAPGARR